MKLKGLDKKLTKEDMR